MSDSDKDEQEKPTTSELRSPPPPPPKKSPAEIARLRREEIETERWLEEWLKEKERRAAYRAAHPSKPKTPEQRQRDSTRRRLANVAKRIEQTREVLLKMHQGEYAFYHWYSLPLLEWRDDPRVPALPAQMKRIADDAAAGCPLSAQFLATWQEIFELCDRLRYIQPPEVDYRQNLQMQQAVPDDGVDWDDLEDIHDEAD